MTARFSPFRFRQSSACRRSRNTNRLRIETLEGRRMLAADMPFAGDALEQELDPPSDDLSMTTLTAGAESTGSGSVEMRIDASIDQTDADVQTSIDTAAADQVFELAGDLNADSVVNHDDDLHWKASFSAIGSTATGNDGVFDAATYTIWRDNLGASTVPSSSNSFNAPAGHSDEPAEDLSSSFDTDADIDTPASTDAVDHAFALDDAASDNLDTSSPTVALEGSENNAGEPAQPSADADMDGYPGGLLETETGVETIGPDDTGVEFGIIGWIKDFFGPSYEDVKTPDDFDKIRRTKYDKYVVEREINKKSHEEACKAVDVDGDLAEAFKRVYESEK